MKAFMVLLFAVTACSNAGSDLGFTPTATHNIVAEVYLDRDASNSRTNGDTVVQGVRLRLAPPEGGQSVLTSTTDQKGLSFFNNVPVGEYSLSVDPTSVGDTLQLAAIDPGRLQVRALGDTSFQISVRLSFVVVSIKGVRSGVPGKRVLIRGMVLAGVQSFRDTTSHVQDTSGFIRLTRVTLRGGLTGNSPGDTVAVVGTISSRNGQPTLDLAVITTFGSRPPPVPFSLSTAAAASASGGTLDAALVQITGATISDTATTAPDFRVTGNDGTGPLVVLLDAQGGFNRSSFRPGRTMTVRGVLVPGGAGQWVLKPRSTGDVQVF